MVAVRWLLPGAPRDLGGDAADLTPALRICRGRLGTRKRSPGTSTRRLGTWTRHAATWSGCLRNPNVPVSLCPLPSALSVHLLQHLRHCADDLVDLILLDDQRR